MASQTDRDTIAALHRSYAFPAPDSEDPDDALVVERAHGHTVWDTAGRAYLDFDGGTHGVCVGHANEDVVSAMVAQLERGAVASPAAIDPATARFSERLAAVTPGRLQHVQVVPSAAHANRLAVAAARAATGRRTVLTPGDTPLGQLPATPEPVADAFGSAVGTADCDVHTVRTPAPWLSSLDVDQDALIELCIQDVRETLAAQPDGRIAAFVAAPIEAAGSATVLPTDYLRRVEPLVREAGGLIIIDESPLGWGRSGGHICAAERWRIEPDVMTFGSGMAGGTPLGCVIATPEVASAVTGMAWAGGGHPASVAGALATLDVIERLELVDNAERQGLRLRAHLQAAAADRSYVGAVRGMGLVQALAIVVPDGSRTPDRDRATALVQAARRHGLLIGHSERHASVVRLRPHLTVDAKEIDEGCRRLRLALDEVA